MHHFKFAHKVLLLALILVSAASFAQKESSIWYFGDFAGLDFNSGDPVALTNSSLATKEGCATISDESGNLLFYTDGTTVWDKSHQIMLNGTGLLGHSSSTMSALIIPKPGSTKAYYIFTIDKPSYFTTEDQPIDGVNYSEVDMNLNNGNGGIVEGQKNIHLITYDTNDAIQNEYKSSEKITAVSHSDGSSIWVITQFINKFYAFKVDYTGVNESPITSTVGQSVFPKFNDDGANISAIGYLKVSPNGKHLAIAHSSTSLGSKATGSKQSGKLLLYDFNNSTGQVSNQLLLDEDKYPYGVEFSPNSKLLYATISDFNADDIFESSDLVQYNLESSNIATSKKTLNTSQNVAGALQLAIDGKIYRAGYKVFGEGEEISVINQPNEIGNASSYTHNTIHLAGRAAQLGLPPFIQSIFKFSFDYEFTCFGDNTHFFITSEDPYDTVIWDFGDGNTSTLEESYHTYAQPGVYTVSLSLSLNGVPYEPLVKQVIISEPPNVLTTPYNLVQCDSFDDNPNDGYSTFNLELANGPLALNTSDQITVYYYHALEDAVDDTENTNAIHPIYTNQSQDEILHAKVYKANTDCYSMATVQLTTTQAVDLNEFDLNACDPLNEGSASFDLSIARNNIISTLNLPSNVTITFYENQSNAAIGTNPVPDLYNSPSSTLYIRVESDNVCYGNGLLNLKVLPFPVLQDQTLNVCQTDFPVYIDSGLSPSIQSNYNFIWSTNQTSNSIEVHSPGIYTLTVINPILNCEASLQIEVIQNEIANIESLDIDNTNVTINLANAINNFEFALDEEFGNYQQNNSFFGVTPGEHTVYIRDIFSCNTISETVHIIGFPKFFTPNNDGSNDFWNVKGLNPNAYPEPSIKIYNRYGKLLKVFNPHKSNGWDGTFNGHLLAPDDYWYYLKLSDGKEYSGHFSLKV